MVEMEKARETNLMIRGEFLNKGKRVNYGTPAILHSWDKSLPNNRLGLALANLSRKPTSSPCHSQPLVGTVHGAWHSGY